MRNSINRCETSSIKAPIFSGRSTISCTSSKGTGDWPSNRARSLALSQKASGSEETRKRKNTQLPALRLQKFDSIPRNCQASFDQTRSFSGSTYSGSADTSRLREKISFPSRESFPRRAIPPLSQTSRSNGRISGENGIFLVSTRNGSFGTKYHPPPMSASRNIRIQSQGKETGIAKPKKSFATTERKFGNSTASAQQRTSRKSLSFEVERTKKPEGRRSSGYFDCSASGGNRPSYAQQNKTSRQRASFNLKKGKSDEEFRITEVYEPYNPNPCKPGPSDVLLTAFSMTGDGVSVFK